MDKKGNVNINNLKVCLDQKNKFGFFRWLFSRQTNNLVKILIALIPAIIAYFGSVATTNKIISISKINNTQNQICNANTDTKKDVGIEKDQPRKTENNETGFNKDSWIFYKEIIPNENGYYCPGKPGFPNWVIWTKNKYKADKETTISFSLLDKTNNNKNPTLILSYGDKTNKIPDIYYSLNILDGDLNTIRLYGSNGKEVQEDRSGENIPLDGYLTITISPVFSGKNSAILIINPSITYLVDSKEEPYIPKKEFKIGFPFTNEKQGDGFQFAIGVSKGDCFKIISTNL